MTTIQNNSITLMLMVNNNVSRKLGPVITSSDALCFSDSRPPVFVSSSDSFAFCFAPAAAVVQ